MDRVTVARAAALYGPLCLAAISWLAGAPGHRVRAAAVLATAWNLPALLAVHALAVRAGWWSYGVTDATIAGFPVDLYVGWAVLWGALSVLVGARVPLGIGAAVAIAVDLVAMPRLFPVVRLGDAWLVGEAVALAVCFVPAQLLARWTRTDSRLPYRGGLQALAFAGIALAVLPAVILEQSGGSWRPLLDRSGWVTGILLQLVGVAGLLGVSAVQEFATRGLGTPIPFDAPRRLVSTGPYAYVANPMQLSAALVMVAWGAMLESVWVAAAGVMAVVYGAGFAAGDERTDLERRFGSRFHTYRSHVRAWIPRWRPFAWPGVDDAMLGAATHGAGAAAGQAVATLYVAEQCGPCSEVRAWFAARAPVGLAIVAAERHPSRSLTRITYDPGDGSGERVGVAALGRALEHIHLGWALIGMFVRLPGVCEFLQAVTDASGGGPRRVVRYCELSEREPRPNRRGGRRSGPRGTDTVSPSTPTSS
jgi:protein-S-isoprenylcysteine O-methyltransferase Ste14